MNTAALSLTQAAFGADAGRWPLPSAVVAEELWLRAVAAGGQGRYATALADLEVLDALAPAGPLPSLAASTRASFLRQVGRHTEARPWDGRALALAGADSDALGDALIGLAADALGVARFALSARLLNRARAVVGSAASPRLSVRLAWVRAELAMSTGRGADAVEHARDAVAQARELGSVRHAVKSDVVYAAALCCAGTLDDARHAADDALDAAETLGLVPLSWAAACLLGDIGSASRPPDTIAEIRTRTAAVVQDRGGAWSDR